MCVIRSVTRIGIFRSIRKPEYDVSGPCGNIELAPLKLFFKCHFNTIPIKELQYVAKYLNFSPVCYKYTVPRIIVIKRNNGIRNIAIITLIFVKTPV